MINNYVEYNIGKLSPCCRVLITFFEAYSSFRCLKTKEDEPDDHSLLLPVITDNYRSNITVKGLDVSERIELNRYSCAVDRVAPLNPQDT